MNCVDCGEMLDNFTSQYSDDVISRVCPGVQNPDIVYNQTGGTQITQKSTTLPIVLIVLGVVLCIVVMVTVPICSKYLKMKEQL